MSAALPLAAAALLVQGDWGWRCEAKVSLGAYQGSVWRDYAKWPDPSPYHMKVELADPEKRHTLRWAVDPRPEGRPPRKRRSWPDPRPPADAFRSGPGFVAIDFRWDAPAVGPIWAHYWGDGAYAGAQRLMTASDATRRIGNLPAFALSTTIARDLVPALASARTWTVVATDATGRQLSSETFEVPAWQEAEAEFRRARASLDAVEPRYRSGAGPQEGDEAACYEHEDPAAII
ncbi:MAG TPA: hypothetical protein VFZ91_13265 [Allosphingosinicella sp.]